MTVPELIDALIELDQAHPNREVHLLDPSGRHLQVGAVEPWWDLGSGPHETKHLVVITGVTGVKEKIA